MAIVINVDFNTGKWETVNAKVKLDDYQHYLASIDLSNPGFTDIHPKRLGNILIERLLGNEYTQAQLFEAFDYIGASSDLLWKLTVIQKARKE